MARRAVWIGLSAVVLAQWVALGFLLAHNASLRAKLTKIYGSSIQTTKPRPTHASAAPAVPETNAEPRDLPAANTGFILDNLTAYNLSLPQPTAPSASSWTEIPAHVPRRAWRSIVIHHSATPTGSAETFEAYHRSRGMNNGLAYHFVINNGSQGTDDGEVEVGSRWLQQLWGGHCRQDAVNQESIGICLVGDFSRVRPTEKQMATLARLVLDLQKQFGIPAENILGHGQVAGEYSECPGKSFPWETFLVALKQATEADRLEMVRAAAFASEPSPPPLNP